MPTPRSVKFMSDELIDQLFSEFKKDKQRWEEFAKRELSDVKSGTEEPPGRAAIVEEFVREKLGPDHGYEVGGVIIEIRKALHNAKLW
jgi:hypothetical protein